MDILAWIAGFGNFIGDLSVSILGHFERECMEILGTLSNYNGGLYYGYRKPISHPCC